MVLVPYSEHTKISSPNANAGLSEEIISQSIPKTFHNKARTILEYIRVYRVE